MDSFSLTANIIAILQLTGTFTSYCNDARKITQDQAKLAIEASNLYGLLTSLHFRVAEADSNNPWFNQVNLLGQENGPLAQYKEILEEMVRQVEESRKRYQTEATLTWQFSEAKVGYALTKIERLKSLVQYALKEDLLSLNQAIHSDFGTLSSQTKQLHIRAERLSNHANQELLHRLRSWLGIPDPSTNYQAALQKRCPNTGRWLINGSRFQAWKNSETSLMWLHGSAGCGKTILSAAALEQILQLRDSQPDTAIGYFYFDFSDGEKQISTKAIRSLLFQVAQNSSDGRQSLQQLYQRCGSGQRQPSEDTIRALFHDILGLKGLKYIVLDALDECIDRKELLTFLCELVNLKVTGFRMLVTSRPERDLEYQLAPIANYNIKIQAAVVDEDIRVYVQSRFSTDRNLKKWPEHVRDEVSTVLMEKANGMFRWVYCQLELIRHCVTLQGLRSVLSSLPLTLEETYNRILSDIEAKGFLHDAVTVFQWLCFSNRPLLLSEIVEVLAIEYGENGGFFPENRLPDPADVAVICLNMTSWSTCVETQSDEKTNNGSNVNYNQPYDNDSEASDNDEVTDAPLDNEVDDSTDTQTNFQQLQFVHFSITEYLLSERCPLRLYFLPSTCHQLIAEGCLRYLLFLVQRGPLTKDIISSYPLAQYAAQHWWQHAHRITEADGDTVLYLASELFDVDATGLLSWLQLYNPDQPWLGLDLSLTRADMGPALYYAACIGLPKLVHSLFSRSENVDMQGGHYGNALQAASAGGHLETAWLLIDRDADTNAQGGQYGNALQAASAGGHLETVRLLIDRGADTNAQGGSYGTSLYAASVIGHTEVVHLLVNEGADVNVRGGIYGSPLQVASRRGYVDIVRLLVDRGADINLSGGKYGNALQAASAGRHEKIVQFLTSRGVDVNAQGGHYGNALQAASSRGHEKTVQLLLLQGANANAQGGQFGSALQAASAGGHEMVVQMLLKAGAIDFTANDTDQFDFDIHSISSTLIGSLDSTSNIEAARECLIQFFSQDECIKPLLSAVVKFSTLGKQQLADILRFHFKAFASDLVEEKKASTGDPIKSGHPIWEVCKRVQYEARSVANEIARSSHQRYRQEVFAALHARSQGADRGVLTQQFLHEQDALRQSEAGEINNTSTLHSILSGESRDDYDGFVAEDIGDDNIEEDTPSDSDSTTTTSEQLDTQSLVMEGFLKVFENSYSFGKLIDGLWRSVQPDLFDLWTINLQWQQELGESVPVDFRYADHCDIGYVTEEDLWISDKIKLMLERFTAQPWDWRPFKPPKKPVSVGKVRLSYASCCQRMQSFDISPLLAEKVKKFMQLPAEARKDIERPATQANPPNRSEAGDISRTTDAFQANLSQSPPSSAQSYLNLQKTLTPDKPSDPSLASTGSHQKQQSQQSSDFILFCVRNMSGPNSLRHSQIAVPRDMTDNEFFEKFRQEYRRLRGWHYWLHPEKFWFCHCSRFYKWDVDKISWEQHEMPSESSYVFAPKPPADPYKLPISRDEWEHRYHQDCSLAMRGDFLHRIPKRDQRFEIDTCINAHQTWGLYAEYRTSARVVLTWSFIAISPGILFFIWWLIRFGNDLQNASVPVVLITALVSLPVGIVTLGGQFKAAPRD